MNHRHILKNIVVMAMVDGALSENELALLSERCEAWGLDENELQNAISQALSADAAVSLPIDPADREPFLAELLRMMAADGHLSESEKRLFALIAAKLDFDRADLDRLITRLSDRQSRRG
jgi:uncharacterized tellurite resistance protein B-like protein